MCSYFVRSEPLFKQKLFFHGQNQVQVPSFWIAFAFLQFFFFFIHVFLFYFFKSEFFFNLFKNLFSCISISLIFTVSTPKLLTYCKSSSPTISSSTILLRISNFKMVILISEFNYFFRSNNSDLLMPQVPPFWIWNTFFCWK